MLVLLSSILLLLGCWQLDENGKLTKNNYKRILAAVINATALSSCILGFGLATGTSIYFSLLSVTVFVFMFFHLYLIDPELKPSSNG